MAKLGTSFYRYVFCLGAFTSGLLIAVAAFCAFVDPYGIFGSPTIPGLTSEKQAAAEWQRLSKPYRVLRHKPATLLLGSSTVNIGLDPDSSAWPAQSRPVYNLGIDGASIEAQHRLLQHALDANRPRQVVISLSMEDMMVPPNGRIESKGPLFEFEDRLRVTADGTANRGVAWAHFKDAVFATLSFRAMRDSLLTLIDQGNPEANVQTENGFDRRGRLRQWAQRDGSIPLVEAALEMQMKDWDQWRHAPAFRFEALRSLIRDAIRSGADVIVIITPTWAPGLEARRQVGLTQLSVEWRRSLVAATEAEAAAAGRPENVTVWDFSRHTRFTDESLPSRDSRGRGPRWFFETVHFTPELGSLIIARINNDGPPGFGVRLSSSMLASYETASDEEDRHWAAQHPDEIGRVADLLVARMSKLCSTRQLSCEPGAANEAPRH